MKLFGRFVCKLLAPVVFVDVQLQQLLVLTGWLDLVRSFVLFLLIIDRIFVAHWDCFEAEGLSGGSILVWLGKTLILALGPFFCVGAMLRERIEFWRENAFFPLLRLAEPVSWLWPILLVTLLGEQWQLSLKVLQYFLVSQLNDVLRMFENGVFPTDIVR